MLAAINRVFGIAREQYGALTMRCEKAQEIFSDYLEGTLERPMVFTLEHHLGECAECGRDYERFRETWQMLDSLPTVEAPAGLRESVLEKIQAQQTARRRLPWSLDLSKIFQPRVPIRVAAGLAAVALFGVMVFQTISNNQLTQARITGTQLPQTTKIGPGNNYTEWQPGDKQRDPGLQISVTGTPISGDRTLYRIDLKDTVGAKIDAKAYLMNQGMPVFTNQTLQSADVIFDQALSGRQTASISVVVAGGSGGDVVYLTWGYNSQPMSEAVFLPNTLTTTGVASAPFAVSDATVFEALQRLSSTYGVVVMADGSVSGRVGQVSMGYGTPDDALYRTMKALSRSNKGQDMHYTPVTPNTFKVEKRY